MFNITLYNNTNFDPVNTPDSLATLTAAATSTTELPAVEILQNYCISQVSVRATYDQVKNGDYCKVGDFFYFIAGMKMTSPDVAVLSLIPDFLTSALNGHTIEAIEGTTIRRRVSASEDIIGAFSSDDPLCAPQQPLVLDMGPRLFDGGHGTSTVVESLIDLADLETRATSENPESLPGRTFYDPQDKNKYVTVPYNQGLQTETTFKAGTLTLPSTKTQLYMSGKVLNGMSFARTLGIEGGIVSQTNIPPEMVNFVVDGKGLISSASGQVKEESSGLNIAYATVKNKRVLYGSYNKYGILTMAGNKTEFNVEDITNTLEGAPTVTLRTDPRPNGKPYFRFTSFKGDKTAAGFQLNAVGGMEQAAAPLKFTEKSGSLLDTYNYNSSMKSSQINRQAEVNSQVIGAVQSAANIATTAGNPEALLSGGDASAQMINSVAGIASSINNAQNSYNQYHIAREKEMMNYGFSQAVVVPQLSYPLNASLLRDTQGNGCFVYRYRYSDQDVKRIDKLLTMYGYADQRTFSMSMLYNHSDFDYVQLSGVSVGGDLPMQWRNGIVAQLNTGVRFQHTKPSTRYY